MELLPNATLQVFAGVGHLPHEERAAEVTAALMAFLREDDRPLTTDD